MDVLIVIGGLLLGIALGVPIAYALALAALAGAWWIGIPIEAVMLQISSGVSKFAMLTIPFFVLAGAIMAEGGMARRLVAFANVIVGLLRLRGGLSLVNIMATTFMSGISGSSVADVSHKLDVLRGHCDAEGRDYDAIEKTIIGRVDPGGDVSEFLGEMEEYAKLGIDLVEVAPAMPDPARFVALLGEKVVRPLAEIG